jgi:(p)ppGpp synthase/HD superfamily hydrolase
LQLTERYRSALTFAFELHARQVRKGSGVPYIAHLLAVSSLVIEYGGDEDQAIAALLHDAIEDQGGDPARVQIRERFGNRVERIVEGCTDTDTRPKPPWRTRKEAYFAHLEEADAATRLVSLADKVHNARAIVMDYRGLGEELWPRFAGGREGTIWYYRSLADAFRRLESSPLSDELERTVVEIERLATTD